MNRAEKRRQQKLAGKMAKGKQPGKMAEGKQPGKIAKGKQPGKMAKGKQPGGPTLNINQTLNLAAQHHTNGRLPEAVTLYQQVLQADPNHPVALQLLGVTALQTGNNEDAVALISKAIAIKPDYADAHNNLGNAFKNMEKMDDALACYQKAISINPDYADAHSNLGTVLADQGRFEEAVASYDKAIAINPGYAEAHFNLANVLQELGNFDGAFSSFPKSLAIKPDNAEAHFNLGLALKKQEKVAEAMASFKTTISLNPDYAEAYSNLGAILADQQNFDEAEQCFLKVIAIRPDDAEAYNNLGITLRNLRRLDEADKSYRQALTIRPDYDEAHSNLIFLQDLIPAIDQVEQQAERRRWNDKFIKPLAKHIRPHDNKRDPERPLRIGYVSADFYGHSASLGFAPLISEHDREKFDVVCYDSNPVCDEVSKTLRGAATQWRDIKMRSDEELAGIIRDDAIDILVDLSGHTRGNRLKLFGYKPAPLQVTGIGHLSPGISTIDYRLTTPLMTPPGEERIYPENPIYLNTYCAYTPPHDSPPTGPPPCRKNGFITFGFLGRFSKASEDVLALWGRILRDVPGSRLLLKFGQLDDPAVQQDIKQTFASFGVTEDRLILLGKTDQRDHLEAYNLVDIVFDTFPHGGGITSMDSLWMGVPVLGLLLDNKIIGRSIDFICQPVGLEDWVARSPEQYRDIARDWAGRAEELAILRQETRHRFLTAYARFPQDVEKSYRLIWQRWCKGEATAPVYPLRAFPV